MGEILTYFLLAVSGISIIYSLVNFGRVKAREAKFYILGTIFHRITIMAVCGYALGWWG